MNFPTLSLLYKRAAHDGLEKLKQHPEIYITHLKPREAELIMQEVGDRLPKRGARMLENNHVFEL
jgi:hypothetical protein